MVKDSPLIKIKEDNNLDSNGDKIQKSIFNILIK